MKGCSVIFRSGRIPFIFDKSLVTMDFWKDFLESFYHSYFHIEHHYARLDTVEEIARLNSAHRVSFRTVLDWLFSHHLPLTQNSV